MEKDAEWKRRLTRTYQDLEKKHTESAIEWESILFQVEEMEKQILRMASSVISLKEYLKGSIYHEHLEEAE
jgi:hypothetical protein